MDEAEIAFIRPAKELAEVVDTCVKQDPTTTTTTTKPNPSNSASSNKQSIYFVCLAFVLYLLA